MNIREYPEPLEIIAEQFRRLPGVGKKSAMRMAFGLVDMTQDEVNELASELIDARSKLRSCRICGNLCEGETCDICADESRDSDVVCVVEDVRSLLAMERIDSFKGRYHVLGGTISPLDGRGPEDINITSLVERVGNGKIKELIIATNPTVEGESTASYIAKLFRPLGVKVTRIGYGIPVGGDLDYADELTLSRAMEGRKEI